MVIDKVLKFIELNKLKNSHVEQVSGLSNGYLRNIKKSNSDIKEKMLTKILVAYPDLESYLESYDSSIPHTPLETNPNKIMSIENYELLIELLKNQNEGLKKELEACKAESQRLKKYTPDVPD